MFCFVPRKLRANNEICFHSWRIKRKPGRNWSPVESIRNIDAGFCKWQIIILYQRVSLISDELMNYSTYNSMLNQIQINPQRQFKICSILFFANKYVANWNFSKLKGHKILEIPTFLFLFFIAWNETKYLRSQESKRVSKGP